MFKIDIKKYEDRDIYFLKGNLDENAEIDFIIAPEKKSLVIDFGELQSINSSGISKWLRWLPLQPSLIYVNCPTHFMQQMSIVPAMAGDNFIESFYVPLFCDRCEKEDFTKMTAAQSKGLTKTSFIRSPECAESDCQMMLDCVPERYFRTIK